MNMRDLLVLGIVASLDTDGGLLLDAPKGALTPELLERIRASKPDLIAEIHSLTVGCATCRHLAQPGLAEPGYCDQRADLPRAYGEGHPLHLLPADRGATCSKWERLE